MSRMQSLKQSLRKSVLTLRDGLPLDVKSRLDSAILARILELPDYRESRTLLGYMNFGSEFSCDSWADQVLKDGKRLALPRVNRHTSTLDLYFVEDLENQLEPGLWGIREPVVERCERLKAINEVEFALLPGIAFTRKGARLGYGGGFYDKLLSGSMRPVLAVAAYGLQLVEEIPQEETDVGVEWIITESETISCRQENKF